MVPFFLGAHRPYDIYNQINILWQVYSYWVFLYLKFSIYKDSQCNFLQNASIYRPGLLGKTKYEFAKTYCDFKYIKGNQGKYFAVILL